MTLVEELERAGAAGSRLSPGQRPVSAVMAADARGMRVYLVALGGAGAAFSYLVVDVRGHPVVSRRAVREAVTLIALAERADEVAGALAGEVVAAAFADCAGRLREHGDVPAATAAEAVADAYLALVGDASAPRVATPDYLDRIGARAAFAAEMLDAYAVHARRLGGNAAGEAAAEQLARAAAEVLAIAARAGDPGAFAASLAAGAGAVDALAADVLDCYLAPLEP